LIEQTSNVADSYGLSAHGILQANHWRTNRKHRLQIASVQTLARRDWPDADVIVIDEAHCQYSSWVEYIKKCRANVIGLSATPFSKGLGLLFSNLINAATMHDLTESGVLVPMRVLSCTRIDMEGAETRGGEWSDSAAASRGMEIVGDVVAEWMQHASERKTIVFGATIEHCEVMARQFNEAGIRAAVFTSNTTLEEREELLKEYKKTDSLLRVLISVEALAKGFDVKDVSCVCDCRPLRKSLSTAIQMWGRGLRSSPDTGKTDCILLDFSGNIIRFREDFEDIFHNGLEVLDSGEKLDKTIRKDDDEEQQESKCPKCGYTPFFKKCMGCGYEKLAKTLIEHLPGVMQEIKIGKSHAADNSFQLYQMCCTYSRQSGNPETQKQRAYYLYRDIVGDKPKWNFELTPNHPISRAVMNKIMQKKIAYAKAIGAA
jgi:superfamily II DNA or RNA helicase